VRAEPFEFGHIAVVGRKVFVGGGIVGLVDLDDGGNEGLGVFFYDAGLLGVYLGGDVFQLR
jgi:hypothetical protein